MPVSEVFHPVPVKHFLNMSKPDLENYGISHFPSECRAELGEGRRKRKRKGCVAGAETSPYTNITAAYSSVRKNLLYWLFSFLPVCKPFVIPVLGLVVLG